MELRSGRCNWNDALNDTLYGLGPHKFGVAGYNIGHQKRSVTEPNAVDLGNGILLRGLGNFERPFMLKPANQNAKFCYERALAAGQQAANARTAADREFWLNRESRWLKAATYYEYSERLTAFIGELRSPPKQPICSACDVLMSIRRLHTRSDGSTEYHYECLTCEAKQTVVDY